MKIIGFAGTAKNTGKTTAALDLIRSARQAGLRLALTSIGYDGEDLDHVTGLPKPRYELPTGMVVATAERCLEASTAGFLVLKTTRVDTILGKVMIAQVCAPGLVRVAGPNRDHDLQEIYRDFRRLGVDLALVDGALNRIVPMVGVDGLVLSTGAAFSENIDMTARHAGALVRLFSLPPFTGRTRQQIWVERFMFESLELETNSLLNQETAEELKNLILDGAVMHISIPGACDPNLLRWIIVQTGDQLAALTFCFASPLHMIASGSPQLWEEILNLLAHYGGGAACLRTVPLRYMTVNSFYPRYLGRVGDYEPAWVDAGLLRQAVRAATAGVQVLDLQQPPLPDRLELAGLSEPASIHPR